MIEFEYTLKKIGTVVSFTIHEQSEELYQERFLDEFNESLRNVLGDEALELRCASSPEIGDSYIYLRGDSPDQDDETTARHFRTEEEALAYYTKLAQVLKTITDLLSFQNGLAKEQQSLSPIVRKTRSLNARWKSGLLTKCKMKSVFAKGEPA